MEIFHVQFYFILQHFSTSHEGIYIIIDNNCKPLKIFQQIHIYLNEPIKISKLIKLANQ